MWRDEAYMLDMLQAAQDAHSFTSGLTRAEFDKSRIAQYAVAHALQIMGDAAAHVSEESRAKAPSVQWAHAPGPLVLPKTPPATWPASGCSSVDPFRGDQPGARVERDALTRLMVRKKSP